jgi:hypothetical protein
MKLSEILQEAINLDKPIPISLKSGLEIPDIKGELLGKGVEASAYHTGQGTITKIIGIDPDESPKVSSAIRFLKLILQHQDNPFFPRIYNAKLYRNRNYKGMRDAMEYFIMVQIEKLIPFSQKNIEDIIPALFKQIGINDDEEWNFKQIRDYKYAFIGADTAFLQKTAARSKNPKFKEAIELLVPYFKQHGMDLHHGNMMIRLTPHGPQLVLTDPLPPNRYGPNS